MIVDGKEVFDVNKCKILFLFLGDVSKQIIIKVVMLKSKVYILEFEYLLVKVKYDYF